ncbi:putative membrane protein [Buchnera aphidicola str. Bp (Baizongia pistaciae)]|uniref:Membrane protein insertase YidC n=1 Tax=Buchnera aphidicola subsp. Baizongia pistaciae (strain Bp) TaxID=224915 RepID=YIDC_BUCBP|nr:membrane protein insertase YidC [Buchnera aphidicola]Q89B34.1 RecName: Full=Membrane protein insertase YidC; AltName: Full=Foldase YidC; AltName: Full=Membrane integrase YidC; AltName: Full=Membrane protein YidC [Buchnera aphidicola str. Bp (Baizongia pistaciae)]AAO26760.1 putative membrane protein [Buchnera aphidicola str. Bp (Baizongia pistaciae)]
MHLQRNFFILIFFFISFLLWKTWQQKEFSSDVHKIINKYENVNLVNNNINKLASNIIIKTDVLKIQVNLYGGDIEKAELLHFKSKLNSSQSLVLLDTNENFVYQAQCGITGKDGADNLQKHIRPLYIAKRKYYELSRHNKKIEVPLQWISKDGIIYKKIFVLKSGEYDVSVKYKINNITNKHLKVSMFGQLKQTINLPEDKNTYTNNFALQTFRGAAYSSDNDKYVKYSFDSIVNKEKKNIVVTHSGWVAMLQKYFATSWIPDNSYLNTMYIGSSGDNLAEIGYYSRPIDIFPHSTISLSSKLWIGPEIQNKMAVIASNLDLTVDYGWLWFLSQPLFKLLNFLYNICGNWGVSIILITFIIKGITFPLTKSQFKTMAKIRKLQPKINYIKKKFKNNNQKISEEIMSLYKTEKVNPLGGCFPLFIQMPIFLALYYMLISSVELRHAPFFLWIHDLSDQDPFYVLPILMGVTMFFIQRVTPSNVTDPVQKKIMNYIPILFTVFFLWFPSGLVLYYLISNLVTIIQQKIIIKALNKTLK